MPVLAGTVDVLGKGVGGQRDDRQSTRSRGRGSSLSRGEPSISGIAHPSARDRSSVSEADPAPPAGCSVGHDHVSVSNSANILLTTRRLVASSSAIRIPQRTSQSGDERLQIGDGGRHPALLSEVFLSRSRAMSGRSESLTPLASTSSGRDRAPICSMMRPGDGRGRDRCRRKRRLIEASTCVKWVKTAPDDPRDSKAAMPRHSTLASMSPREWQRQCDCHASPALFVNLMRSTRDLAAPRESGDVPAQIGGISGRSGSQGESLVSAASVRSSRRSATISAAGEKSIASNWKRRLELRGKVQDVVRASAANSSPNLRSSISPAVVPDKLVCSSSMLASPSTPFIGVRIRSRVTARNPIWPGSPLRRGRPASVPSYRG